MAPPNYKLVYFDAKGRAEPIRFLFAYAGVPYEDQRLPRDQWPALKPSSPMGQVPYLEFDGKKLGQSVAIMRYLANKFGLAGDNDFERAQADAFLDGIGDLRSNMRPLHRSIMGGESEEQKKELKNKFKTDSLVPFLDKYEKFLSTNGSGHLVGQKMSWADIVLGEMLASMEERWDKELLSGHPKLAALQKSVFENPGIQKYVAGRPDTKM